MKKALSIFLVVVVVAVGYFTFFDNEDLKSENPIALLKGNKSLSEFGLRNGSIINYTEQEIGQWKIDIR